MSKQTKTETCRMCHGPSDLTFTRDHWEIRVCSECNKKIIFAYFETMKHEDPAVWDALVYKVCGKYPE